MTLHLLHFPLHHQARAANPAPKAARLLLPEQECPQGRLCPCSCCLLRLSPAAAQVRQGCTSAGASSRLGQQRTGAQRAVRDASLGSRGTAPWQCPRLSPRFQQGLGWCVCEWSLAGLSDRVPACRACFDAAEMAAGAGPGARLLSRMATVECSRLLASAVRACQGITMHTLHYNLPNLLMKRGRRCR